MAIEFEFWLEVLLAVLLTLTVGYCFALDRKLRALRRTQADFERLLAEFTQATEKAESGVAALRQASGELVAELDEKLSVGRALGDELATITQSGNALAERIEVGLLERPPVVETAAAWSGRRREPDAKRSESERELLEALRQAR